MRVLTRLRRIHRRPVFYLLLILTVNTFPASAATSKLDNQLLTVAQDTVKALVGKGITRLAVVNFEFLDGSTSAETKYITDTITVHLAQQAPIGMKLVERSDLSALRAKSDEQMRLADDALLDRARMTSRNILGVDSILLGIITPMDSQAELSTRVLDVRTGNVVLMQSHFVSIPRFSNTALNTIRESSTDKKVREQEERVRKAERKQENSRDPQSTPLYALANRIVEKINGTEVKKLAVSEFMLDNRKSMETKYLSDQFTTRLFEHGPGFNLVGRADMEAILAAYKVEQNIAKEIDAEHTRQRELEESMDEPYSKDLDIPKGALTKLSIQGIDAILVGKITSLAQGPEITVKVLDVKTASLYLADKAWIEIPRFAESIRDRSKEEERAQKEKEKVAQKLAKEAEKAEKRRLEAENERILAIAAAMISGCPRGSVTVHPRAAQRRSFLTSTASLVLRVTNLNENAISISDENGPLVQNLCPGGSLTITRSLQFLSSTDDSFEYVATGTLPNGKIGYDTKRYRIYKNRPQQQSETWQIRLRQ